MYAHTVKPEEDAQTLVPSLLKIAALSKLPVPTRLSRLIRLRGGEKDKGGGRTWYQRTLSNGRVSPASCEFFTSRDQPCHDMMMDSCKIKICGSTHEVG